MPQMEEALGWIRSEYQELPGAHWAPGGFRGPATGALRYPLEPQRI